MANLFELPRYIAVEGPIRVGKSTLAGILAERLNAQRVMEPPANPFLAAFYEGEKGAAFQAQFAFLAAGGAPLLLRGTSPAARPGLGSYVLAGLAALGVLVLLGANP